MKLDAAIQNRYRLRWREAVRDPSYRSRCSLRQDDRRGRSREAVRDPFDYAQSRLFLLLALLAQSAMTERSFAIARFGQDDRDQTAGGAGCCWLRQWTEPRPQIRSVEGTLTTRRLGKRRCRACAARASVGASKVGIRSARLAM